MSPVLHPWIILSLLQFPELGSARAMNCTVTQEDGRTLYRVPEFKATQCYYWWSNGSHHVLANHVNKSDKQVVENSNWSLATSECFELIHYRRDCISEGTQREAKCTTRCSGNAKPWSWGVHIPIIITVVVIILLLLLVVLCYKLNHRKQRCLTLVRKCGATQCGL